MGFTFSLKDYSADDVDAFMQIDAIYQRERAKDAEAKPKRRGR